MITVMIIDDHNARQETLAGLIQTIESHLEVVSFTDPTEGVNWARWHAPDLVVTQYHLPNFDGVEFIKRVRGLATCRDVPVLLVVGAGERDVLNDALDAGTTDFLVGNMDHFECFARCRNLLTQQRQRKIIQDRARWLEKRVAEATTAIRVREHETLLRLAKAGEYRDEETGNHVIRMAKFSRLIAEGLGLTHRECEIMELAAPMHDIGKIGIPDTILLKCGSLTDEEFEIMKRHTRIGYEILKDSPSEYLQMGAVIALGHHERFDGSGYPDGLHGSEIPLAARIVAVADAYDALTSRRPYKQPWSPDEAVRYLNEHRDRQFDPECLDAFNAQLDKVLKIQYMLRDRGHRHRKAQ